MDWQGQKLAERLMQIILFLGGAISFVIGFALKSYSAMMYAQAISVGLTILVTVPDWPFYNRHPLNWLDPSAVKPEGASKVTRMVKERETKKATPGKTRK